MSDDRSQHEVTMSSSRPYMVRAMHAWITDNGLTPYIVVDATQPLVSVPSTAAMIRLQGSRSRMIGSSLVPAFPGSPRRSPSRPLRFRRSMQVKTGRGWSFRRRSQHRRPLLPTSRMPQLLFGRQIGRKRGAASPR
jgi:hypothetical protein